MIDFATLQGVAIPEGVVTQIESGGVVLWKLDTGGGAVVLEVEKVTSDTYAGETTYTGEQFILLDIYPKTNGTVSVTYGGLTKTITDTSGAAEPNAQQVFFGTFNGVSDSVETPASGMLTIDGDYRGVGCGGFSSSSKLTTAYLSVKDVVSLGSSEMIPPNAYGISVTGCTLSSVDIPSSVKSIGTNAFTYCENLKSVRLSEGLNSIGDYAFQMCTGLESIEIPSSVTSIGAENPFNGCSILHISVKSNSQHYSSENGALFDKGKTEILAYPAASGNYAIPSGVTTIGNRAFNSTEVSSVIIPSSVTSIGNGAFNNCNNLASVTIPSSVLAIGDSAFRATSSDFAGRTVTMQAATPPTLGGDAAFDDAGKNNIVVPSGCGAAYKAAQYWSEYADYIVEG